MTADRQGDLFDQTPITATFRFTVPDGGMDPDMAAMWLSEDADVQTAVLVEFQMGGVTFRRAETGYWERSGSGAGDAE